MKITHDFHIHINLSMCAKGKADFEGYMETFEKMGHTKVGFSDHFWDNDVPIDFAAYTPRNRITRFYTEQGFAHVQELLEMGLDIPPVTRVFLRLRELGLAVEPVFTLEQATTVLAGVKGGNADA